MRELFLTLIFSIFLMAAEDRFQAGFRAGDYHLQKVYNTLQNHANEKFPQKFVWENAYEMRGCTHGGKSYIRVRKPHIVERIGQQHTRAQHTLYHETHREEGRNAQKALNPDYQKAQHSVSSYKETNQPLEDAPR